MAIQFRVKTVSSLAWIAGRSRISNPRLGNKLKKNARKRQLKSHLHNRSNTTEEFLLPQRSILNLRALKKPPSVGVNAWKH